MITKNMQVSMQAEGSQADADTPLVHIEHQGDRVSFDLAGLPEADAVARSLVRQYFGAAFGYRTLGDLLVCTSELISNAVLHTRSGQANGRVLVVMQVLPADAVLVAVHDQGACAIGSAYDRGKQVTPGRGLDVVRGLAAGFGFSHVATGGLAWCVLTSRAEAVRS